MIKKDSIRNKKFRSSFIKQIVSGVLTLTLLLQPMGNVMANNEKEEVTNNTMKTEPVRVPFKKSELEDGRSNFDESWKFKYGDQSGAEKNAFDDSNWQKINLPHDYSLDLPYSKSGEAESGYKLGGIGWYRKSFYVDEDLKDKKFIVEFGGVYNNATIYINGNKIGSHPYGYTPFAFDLSEYINFGEENVLAVKVNHKFPSSRWYAGSGIYRSVYLNVSDKVHVDYQGIKITTPNISNQLGGDIDTNIEAKIINDTDTKQNVKIQHKFREKGKDTVVALAESTETIEANSSKTINSNLIVKTAKTWSIENPNLYEIESSVVIDDKVSDTKYTDFGFRTISSDPNKGFSLNGEVIKLKGVSMHHDQGSLGAAAHYRAIERQVEILKDMGVNAIRVTHNPASDEIIDIANKKGMLIIDEAFDAWIDYKNGNIYDYTEWFEKPVEDDNQILGKESNPMTWAEFDVKSMVKRGINSPAIIKWSLGNEVMEGNNKSSARYAQYPAVLQNLINWVKEVDNSRFVTLGDNKFKASWSESTQFGNLLTKEAGTVGMNYSSGNDFDRFHREHPDWHIYASETASAINSRGQYKADEINKLYTSYDTKTVGWGMVAAQSWYTVVQRDFVQGEFVWTGFDYLGEPTNYNNIGPGPTGGWPSSKSSYFGIVDTAGLPKDTYYFYRSQWNQEDTTLHILPAWHEELVSQDIKGNVKINIYSNAKAVELFFTDATTNEKTSLGKKEFTEMTTPNGYKYQMYQGADKSNKDYENLYLRWDVPYKSGKLTAVAYDGSGNIISETVGRSEVSTYKEAKTINLTVDRNEILADGKDLSYIEIDILDENQELVASAENLVNIEVSGDGELLAMDNGHQADHEPYNSGKRKVLAGKAIAIVKSGKKGTGFTVTAKSEGLETAQITVNTKATSENEDMDGPIAYSIPRYHYVKLGSTPELVNSVRLHYKDSSKDKDENVAWEDFDVKEAGIYKITGSIEGMEYKVQTNLVVLDEIAGLLNYSTAALVNSDEIKLPDTRPLVQKDGKVMDLSFTVNWEKQDPELYKKPGLYEVKGTSEIFGQKYEVLATIRISDGEKSLSENIGPLALDLVQKNDANKFSDNLNAINDGKREFGVVSGGSNHTVWTNYDAAQDGVDTAEITFTYATAQLLTKAELFFYQDAWSARMPGKVELQYSADGTSNWTKLETQEIKKEKQGDVPSVTPVEYTFEPVSATGFRIILTTSGEDFGNRLSCVGLTEVELFTVATSLEKNNASTLSELKINEYLVEEDLEKVKEIYREESELSIEAKSDENASITILPPYKSKITIITESENGENRDLYTIHFKEEIKDIDKSLLEAKIKEIEEELDQLKDSKTEETLSNLEKELELSKALLEYEDANQEDIDKALSNLEKAYEELQDKPETDKEENPVEEPETDKEENPVDEPETGKEENPVDEPETDKEKDPVDEPETDKEENPDILPGESDGEMESPGDKTDEDHTEEENIETVIEKIDGKGLLNEESLALLKSRNLDYRDIYFINTLTKERVKVSTPKKISLELESTDDLKVYHVEKDGSLKEILKTEINGKTVSFIHDDFSPFVFSTARNNDNSVVDKNPKQKEVDHSPKTSDIRLSGFAASIVLSLALVKFLKKNKEDYSL